jgi:hypothetical protein
VQVEKAAGVTKDAAWIAKVHEEIAQDSCSELGVGADKLRSFAVLLWTTQQRTAQQ